ncbi:MAG: YihY/virulence factor BrkB family protein [Blastocatellales bacterium]
MRKTVGEKETRKQLTLETMEQLDSNPAPVVTSASPTSPTNLSFFTIVGRVWNKIFEDDVLGRAAQLAYYWLFSLFPLMIFLTALLAYIPIPRKLDFWLGAMRNVLPLDAYRLVDNTFHEIVSRQRGGLLSFSIILAIWVSSSGMESMISSINRAYRTTKPRPWWKERLLSISLTLGLAVFVLSALLMVFFGEFIGSHIADLLGLGKLFQTVFSITQWPLTSILILIGIDLIYYFAPNIKQRWKWFTPGAIFAVVCWLLISFGFRYYVSRFGNYNATYGTLGGVMVLMLWFYLTGMVILIGGEINSVTRPFAR